MTDEHTVTRSGEDGTQTFDLVSFLHLPSSRMRCADVRWLVTPLEHDGALGARVRQLFFTTGQICFTTRQIYRLSCAIV